MGRITFAIYRAKPGKDKELLQLIDEHLLILHAQNLVTARKPIVMQAKDKSIIEVFEWRSRKAIDDSYQSGSTKALGSVR